MKFYEKVSRSWEKLHPMKKYLLLPSSSLAHHGVARWSPSLTPLHASAQRNEAMGINAVRGFQFTGPTFHRILT